MLIAAALVVINLVAVLAGLICFALTAMGNGLSIIEHPFREYES